MHEWLWVLITVSMSPNFLNLPYLQSGEVCRRLLAPGSHTGGWRLRRAAHGCVDSGANGHERQQHHRGLCATSHQASFRFQCRALQKAGLPNELQEAWTSTNEPMTLGLPMDIRTLQISLLLILLWLFKFNFRKLTPFTSSSSHAFSSLSPKSSWLLMPSEEGVRKMLLSETWFAR